MDWIFYVIDTETTGLDKEKNEIIEISMLRINDDVQKTWCIKPENYESIQPDALRVNGHKIEDLKHLTQYGRDTYRPASEVLPEMENWMMEDLMTSDRRILVGQNSIYDLNFLEEFWKKLGQLETFPFGRKPFTMDTRQIALLMDLAMNTSREYYNLSNLVSDYGIKKEKAHRAVNDTKMTADLWKKQLEILKKALNKS